MKIKLEDNPFILFNVKNGKINDYIDINEQTLIIEVDCKKVQIEDHFFKYMKKVLNLPKNYGENNNAFSEYMRDFDYININGRMPSEILFVFKDYEFFCADEEKKELIQNLVLTKLLKFVITQWREGFDDNVTIYPPTPFSVLITNYFDDISNIEVDFTIVE
ncbi:MAG: barstar family protein [Mycoplasmatales bacterium]